MGDLNTDDIVVGKEWSIPLGTGVVKVNEIIDLNKVPEINTTQEGNYYMRFEEGVDVSQLHSIVNKSLLPAGGIALPTISFHLDDLSELFPTNFVLGLENPSFTVQGVVEGNGSIGGSLQLTATGGQYGSPVDTEFSTTYPFMLQTPTYSARIEKDLDKLIEGVPQVVEVAATISSMSEGITGVSRFNYVLDLPFIPSAKFRATSIETIKDVFSESLIDYLFSSGTTTIYGTFDNELPFNMDVQMYITDSENKRLDVDLPVQQVIGTGVQEVFFEFQSKDIPKMESARNIELEFSLSGRAKEDITQAMPSYLNENQKLTMVLKLKTTGGIKL